jgi:hypothetical protein
MLLVYYKSNPELALNQEENRKFFVFIVFKGGKGRNGDNRETIWA